MPLDAEGNWQEPRVERESVFSPNSIKRSMAALFSHYPDDDIKAKEAAEVFWESGLSIADVERLPKQFRADIPNGYWVYSEDGKAEFFVYGRTYMDIDRNFVKVYTPRGKLVFKARGYEAGFAMRGTGFASDRLAGETDVAYWRRKATGPLNHADLRRGTPEEFAEELRRE